MEENSLKRKKRMLIELVVVVILLFSLILRVGYIQLIDGARLKEMALKQQSLERNVGAKRGTIYDSTGENILANKIYEINVKKIKLNKIIDLVLQNFKHALSLKSAKLDNLSPEKILKMGYVKINKNNKTIISKKQLNKDDKINICFLDGCVSAKVLE